MRYSIFFLVLLCMPSCSTVESQTDMQALLAHRISVPREYAWGRSNPFLDSPADRYVRSYDQAWWSYIEDLSHNIDDRRTASARLGGKWPSDPSEIAGFRDGFAAAETRVHYLITRFGKQRTEDFLKQVMGNVLRDYPDDRK